MSNIDQMSDILSYMTDFEAFTDEEFLLVKYVREILKRQDNIACTASQYCVDG